MRRTVRLLRVGALSKGGRALWFVDIYVALKSDLFHIG